MLNLGVLRGQPQDSQQVKAEGQQTPSENWVELLVRAIASMPEDLAVRIVSCIPQDYAVKILSSVSDPYVKFALILLTKK
ncbi:hypothetical protein ODS41_09965 [Pyrobaculum sp. 3827-6]|uniref:hypothetical protein n=1 Tax=Pyrobaculum sp. 3827-6 TaxID=2983604 RepID=UPI0021D8046E|nr:hypothetical protein [Pyrobaculum sp. 3827-6]MCU7788235.1 hypothetical protein [Pyrobaculum sp. 3827-6]